MKKFLPLAALVVTLSLSTTAKADWSDGACIPGTWTCQAMQWIADWWVNR